MKIFFHKMVAFAMFVTMASYMTQAEVSSLTSLTTEELNCWTKYRPHQERKSCERMRRILSFDRSYDCRAIMPAAGFKELLPQGTHSTEQTKIDNQ